MNAYTTIYPWAVMFLSLLAATCCIVGGAITSYNIMTMPIKENTGDSRAGNIFFGFFAFVVCCLGAQVCLYVGGKAIGAF